MDVLEVNNLKTSFVVEGGAVHAVRGVSLSVKEGQAIGIVGESGCGKSVSMLSIIRLLPDNAKITANSITFEGVEISKKDPRYLRKLRGSKIGMIFQDSMTSLNPLLTVGKQLCEPLEIHQGIHHIQAKKRALEMLNLVEMTNPEKRLTQYPHELSGGMRQRVMIAMALSCNPTLLIADEPTTALDVTISAQILELMRDLQRRLSTSIIMITHNLGIVANLCSMIHVMYGGIIVEKGTTQEIFRAAIHPYTTGLLNCVPNTLSGERKPLVPIVGTPLDLYNPPAGCPFTDRCSMAMHVCREHMPTEYRISDSHSVRCHLLHPFAKGGGLLA
jgi:oligopeptide transport system ATP-binding protein